MNATEPQQGSEMEALYAIALRTGKLATWETDFVAGTRTWTQGAIDMLRIDAPARTPIPMREANHLLEAMHPDDRYMLNEFHAALKADDEITVHYRIQHPVFGIRHMAGRGRVLQRAADGTPQRVIHIISDDTHRHEAEQQKAMLMRELSHRSKNQLAVISAMARQTARSADTLEDFQQAFDQRLRGLARSIDLLVAQDWSDTPLRALISSQLETFDGRGLERITIEGPDVEIDANMAQALGMSLHELATNAVKYGALSTDAGHITISWSVQMDDDGTQFLNFTWQESDGPAVTPPQRRGFGSVVLQTLVASTINAAPDYQMNPKGVSWRVVAPLQASGTG